MREAGEGSRPGRARARPVRPVEERPVRIVVDGAEPLTLTASPGGLEELAAGHLLARGVTADALREATFRVQGSTVRVALPASAAGRPAVDGGLREHLRAGGVAHVPDCPECASRLRRGRASTPSAARLRAAMAALLDGGSGVHGAALVGAEGIVHAVEDVGRHAAVDRVVGATLLRSWDPAALGLATTARISGEMAYKAARAGFAWVASRSVPTTLAVAIAALVDLPIVARAGSPRAHRFGP